MTYTYYPGCTLRTRAKDLDQYARKSAEALGITLREPENWQCCGAVYPQAQDEIATRLSSVRALAEAQKDDGVLLTVCSACHHVIKRVNHDMQTNDDIIAKVNNYLAPDYAYHGETRVLHYLEMLRDEIGFDALAAKVVNPLKGRRIGAYYGCLLLRPGREMGFDDPENPTIIEDFIRALGAEAVVYPMRNECCGGYITLEKNALAKKKSGAVLESAAGAGADCVLTACPLCMYNLRSAGGLPVFYFTELLAEALGVK